MKQSKIVYFTHTFTFHISSVWNSTHNLFKPTIIFKKLFWTPPSSLNSICVYCLPTASTKAIFGFIFWRTKPSYSRSLRPHQQSAIIFILFKQLFITKLLITSLFRNLVINNIACRVFFEITPTTSIFVAWKCIVGYF